MFKRLFGLVVAVLCVFAPGVAWGAACPNEGLREVEVHGFALPDCRSYEQVSPVEKNSIDAEGLPNDVQTSLSGGRVQYISVAPFGGGEAPQGEGPVYISSRGTGGGWATESAFPPDAEAAGLLGFSEDLSESVVWSEGVALDGAPLTGRSFYVRSATSGGYRLLAGGLQETATIDELSLFTFAGFSGDDSHVVFESKAQLLPQARAGALNAYEVDLSKPQGEQLSLVGVLPAGEGGEAPEEGSVAGAGAGEGRGHYTQSAISVDGSRVFFTALPSERVYVREDEQTTVAVSLGSAHFLSATPDGRYAFYTEGEALYRYDVENGEREAVATPVAAKATGDLTESSDEVTGLDTTAGTFHVGEHIYAEARLTPEHLGVGPGNVITAVGPHTLTLRNPAEESATGVALSSGPDHVIGVLGVSNDGSAVYYAADGVLASNANRQGETAEYGAGVVPGFREEGTTNLYEWHQSATGAASTTFIAQLNIVTNGDESDWSDSPPHYGAETKAARVTPDGGTLLFASHRSLTGYDNVGPLACGTERVCQEVYSYRAGPEGSLGQLICVSCDPNGAPPMGEAVLDGHAEGSGTHSGHRAILTHNLSENGNRVFFDSQDALVPGDTNGQMDVYEWEADGEGSCRSGAQDGGCLYSISSGTSPNESYFGDASANGDDVFFFTRQELAPSDNGENDDVYDARVCGRGDGTCEEPEGGGGGQSLSCSGEGCLGGVGSPPVLGAPASALLTGSGNLPAPPPAAPAVRPKAKPLTGAERLAAALKVCRRVHGRRKRVSCETQARKRYATKATATKTRGGKG